MADTRFFQNHGPFPLSHILAITGAKLVKKYDESRMIHDLAALDKATTSDISFFDNTKYLEQFKSSHAGICFIREKYVNVAPESMQLLICQDPYLAYAITAQTFYPSNSKQTTISPNAYVDSSATIGDHVSIEAGAFIGANVMLGNHVSIGANAVIEQGVTIGNYSSIAALSAISHAIIGSHVIIHRGAAIGQDGFGYAMGKLGHIKVPQLGRVVIEDYVEIGANTTIDRGAGPDTVIGQGAKIDNLVQIAHNVRIGKHSVIVAQVGISGSTQLGNGVIAGGQAGITGHLTIGDGVKIAAQAGIMSDLEAGNAYGGSPAVLIRDWHRQTIALNRLTKPKRGTNDD